MVTDVYIGNSSDYIELGTIIKTLLNKKWRIIATSFIVFTLTMLYALIKPPEYQAVTLLSNQQNQLNHSSQASDKIPSLDLIMIPAETTTTQIALIRSNIILSPVIKALNLDMSISPYKKFSFGGLFTRENTRSIHIAELSLPKTALKKPLKLVVIDNMHFQLYNEDDQLLMTGAIGQTAKSQDDYTIKVDKIDASPGSQFTIIKYPQSEVIAKISKKISIVNLSGNSNNNLNHSDLLQISLTGKDPNLLSQILNAIAFTAQKNDIDRKKIEADNLLEFFNKQMTTTHKSLRNLESQLHQYRASSGKIDIKVHTTYLMNHITEIDKEIDATHLKKMNMLQQYTEHHPEVLLLNKKIHQLEKNRNSLFIQLKQLPAADQLATSLTREINAKNSLYLNLLQQAHYLEILKSGIVSDIRVLSPANIPDAPIAIKLSLLGILSIVVGLILGCMLVLTGLVVKKSG